jgi:hypothetical protein
MKIVKNTPVIAAGIIAIFVIIQFIPVNRINPPIEADIQVPAEIKAILRTSCYDCHSHETVWPWYSKVAPLSWLIVHDAQEARESLNFSAWSRYTKDKQHVLVSDVIDVIRDGEMPPLPYTWMHAGSEVTPDELKILEEWAME